MKEKIFLGVILKIEYLIDDGVLGTKCVLLMRPVVTSDEESSFYTVLSNRPFPVEINERLTSLHIKTLRVGDLIEMKSLYRIKAKKDSVVVTKITKRVIPS